MNFNTWASEASLLARAERHFEHLRGPGLQTLETTARQIVLEFQSAHQDINFVLKDLAFHPTCSKMVERLANLEKAYCHNVDQCVKLLFPLGNPDNPLADGASKLKHEAGARLLAIMGEILQADPDEILAAGKAAFDEKLLDYIKVQSPSPEEGYPSHE